MGMNAGDTTAPCWPCYPNVFSQVGAAAKELYVDNLISTSCYEAHHWLTTQPTLGGWADGFPLVRLFAHRS